MRLLSRTDILALCICFAAVPLQKAHSQLNTDHVMIMGRNALYYEDYVLSIQRFNMVIAAKPFLSEPYFYRALAKFYLEDYSGAEMDCSFAIDRNPYTENNYVLRGLCRVNLQKYDKAEEDYKKATDINPLNNTCWFNMVLCQMELKCYHRADSTLDIVINQWPKDPNNYSLKAQIAFAKTDTASALDWIDKALYVDAYNGQAWSMKALVTLNRGEYEQGEDELNKAILQLPRNANLYINRALARYNQNNLRGAMSDYDLALDIEPGNYLGHFNRGLLRAQLADDNKAIDDFNFVLEQEPDNMIALYNRALLLDNTGDYDGAIRDISMVINEYPEFWAGYQARATIRRKIGDVYGAERDEFKVLKAEMDMRAGTFKSQAKTRKKSDTDPSKYDKLVVEDNSEPEKNEYTSEYRGKVQNKTVELTPEPMYLFTYYKKDKAISGFVTFHKLLDTLNSSGVLPYMLYLSNAEESVTEERINAHFEDIVAVTEKIVGTTEHITPYLRRALDYYHVRDFNAALDDLNSAVSLDDNNAIAHYLRGQVRCAQLQADHPAPIAELSAEVKIGYGLAQSDFEKVLSLASDMVYAQYNIGNILVILHEYDKAVEAYSKCLDIDDKFPAAYYNRGVTWLLLNKMDDGLRDLSQAGEYGLYSAYNLIKRYSKDKK